MNRSHRSNGDKKKMYRPTENESYKANDRAARSSKKKLGLQCIKQFAFGYSVLLAILVFLYLLFFLVQFELPTLSLFTSASGSFQHMNAIASDGP